MNKHLRAEECPTARQGAARTSPTIWCLLNLPQDVKGMLQEGLISGGKPVSLLGLNDESLISELAKRAAEEGITVRHLELLVQQLNNPGDVAKKKNKRKRNEAGIHQRE